MVLLFLHSCRLLTFYSALGSRTVTSLTHLSDFEYWIFPGWWKLPLMQIASWISLYGLFHDLSSLCIRPNLNYPISFPSQFLNGPYCCLLSLFLLVLRFISDTMDYRIHFSSASDLSLSSQFALGDADQGVDIQTKSSTTRFIISTNNTIIFWRSKRQAIIVLSTGKAEYVPFSRFGWYLVSWHIER